MQNLTIKLELEKLRRGILLEASYVQAMTYVNYMYEHLEEFQLLLKCSKGSRVENFIEEITIQYTKQNALFVKAAYEVDMRKCLPKRYRNTHFDAWIYYCTM